MTTPLKMLREVLGISQAELGRTIGVTRGRICQIEKRGGGFRRDNLLRLFELYRVQIAQLGLTHEDFIRGETRRPAA